MRKVRFKELRLTATVELKLITVTPLRIGAGKSLDVGEPDLPIVKHSDGTPVIPGSSLKGVFRSTLSRFLGKDDRGLDPIFGGTDYASPIVFTDLRAGSKDTIEKPHIRVDKARGSVARGGLFQVEAVPDNTYFTGNVVSYNLPLSVLAGVVAVNKALMDNDVVRIGGFKSRGYGSVRTEVTRASLSMPSTENSYEVELGNIIGGTKVECNYKVEGNKLSIKEKYYTGEKDHKDVDSAVTVTGSSEDGMMVDITLDVDSFLRLGASAINMWRGK